MKSGEKSIDLGGRKLIAMRDVQDAVTAGATSIAVAANSVVTPSARDFLQQHGIELVMEKANGGSQQAAQPATPTAARTAPAAVNRRLFSSPEAEAIKKEICSVGRKLWMRQFVDGNGGNISYRLGPNEVLCSPTLVSKYDLTPDDIGMTDIEGVQIAGAKPRTSELLLHLEIYKAVPEAKAVVHCHPPHATAYAITGRVPPNLIIPEFDLRNAGHPGICRNRVALCEDAQHGAAVESRHRMLGRHRDARRVVRRGAGDVLLDSADRLATGRAHLANL